jgi:hypothetical protein
MQLSKLHSPSLFHAINNNDLPNKHLPINNYFLLYILITKYNSQSYLIITTFSLNDNVLPLMPDLPSYEHHHYQPQAIPPSPHYPSLKTVLHVLEPHLQGMPK